jgi:hypothetical protein
VNLIDVLILRFYFLDYSNYFLRFLIAIFKEMDYPCLPSRTTLNFWGSSSSIFCSFSASLSRLIFLVLSLMFSLARWLFASVLLPPYFWAWYCHAGVLPFRSRQEGAVLHLVPLGQVASYLIASVPLAVYLREGHITLSICMLLELIVTKLLSSLGLDLTSSSSSYFCDLSDYFCSFLRLKVITFSLSCMGVELRLFV